MAPKRKQRPPSRNFENEATDKVYWDKLVRHSAYRKVAIKTSNSERLLRRKKTRDEQRQTFLSSYTVRHKAGRPKKNEDIVKCLNYWVENESWGYCPNCFLLCTKSLTPKSFNSRGAKYVSKCICQQGKYVVPRFSLIPYHLAALSKEEEGTLRIFSIDIGPKKVARAGNRIKNGAFELRYREDTVQDRIDNITDEESKNRLQTCYDYLKNSTLSCYKQYLQNEKPPNPRIIKIKFWKVYKDFPGIECALWPVLYPFTSWCESILVNSSSILTSFRCKILSNIVDYNSTFELVQFHYDRWLYKTICAAVSISKKMKASPLRTLETKNFSPEYWRWQQRFLEDAVLQFGHPSFFLTISPYEWDFPKAHWIQRTLLNHDMIPTACGVMETIHIAHVLEQLCKGYITGCNTKDWETHEFKHVFFNMEKQQSGNVRCVFFRFEYQNRRSIHLHMLVWLKHISLINLNLLSATVPNDMEQLAFLVFRIQPSDKDCPFLHVSSKPNHCVDERLVLYHTTEDKVANLRAYISTILPVIKSRMDVQTSDGKAALMQYVSSYATKLTHTTDILRSTKTTAFQVAVPFLIDLHPGEPEMAMAFSSTSMSYCNRSRIKVVPPVSELFFDKSPIFQKYLEREKEAESLSCLDFCRKYVVSKAVPTLSKQNNLVGVKYKYIFSPQFFFQFVIMNTPFRNLNQLKHPKHDSIPDELKPLSFMMQNQHHFISDDEKVSNFLSTISYKSFKISEFIRFRNGLILLYYKSFTNKPSAEIPPDTPNIELTYDQKIIYHHIVEKIDTRSSLINRFEKETEICDDYSSTSRESVVDFLNQSSTDSDSSDNTDPITRNVDSSAPRTISVSPKFDVEYEEGVVFDTIKPVLITGKAGSGKSFVIHKVVEYCIKKDLSVLFSCPTAYQARSFLNSFDDTYTIYADTIHSLFKIPIDSSENMSINWSLIRYDVVIIDEVGMVSSDNINHIFKTLKVLPVSPLLIMAGDNKQQKPLFTTSSGTSEAKSIFLLPYILSQCDKFKLYKEIRCDCTILNDILNEIRDSFPSRKTLSHLNNMRCCNKGDVSSEIVIKAFQDNPHTTFLTITRKGSSFINNCIIHYLFHETCPLAEDIKISNGEEINIYQGMQIMITKNICKTLGIVNGQCAVIKDFKKENIVVSLQNCKDVFLHLTLDEDHDEEYYPFIPNYGLTIFKSQGKTLDHVTVWLDNDVVSPGAGYVAFSRARCHKSIKLLEEVESRQVCPISNTQMEIQT